MTISRRVKPARATAAGRVLPPLPVLAPRAPRRPRRPPAAPRARAGPAGVAAAVTIARRVKPARATAAGRVLPPLPVLAPRAPRRPRRPPAEPRARAGPAGVAAGAPSRPPVRASSFIFRGHPEALQGVRLGARAVLPGDVDLEVAERVVGLEVERLVAQALVPPGVANQDVGAEALGAVAVVAVVLDLRGGNQRVHGRAGRQHGTGLTAGSLLHAEAR